MEYEVVYVHAYESVLEERHSLEQYIAFYSQRRPHSALDRKTPDGVYFHWLSNQRVVT